MKDLLEASKNKNTENEFESKTMEYLKKISKHQKFLTNMILNAPNQSRNKLWTIIGPKMLKMLRIVFDLTDYRFFYLSPQLVLKIEMARTCTFQSKTSKTVINLGLHDLDYIIWPLNVSNAHLCLTVGCCNTFTYMVIDSYSPGNMQNISKHV